MGISAEDEFAKSVRKERLKNRNSGMQKREKQMRAV